MSRPVEISQWLQDEFRSSTSFSILRYVVLDDAELDKYCDSAATSLVFDPSHFVRVDMSKGLDDADVQKALSLLKNKMGR